MSNSLQPHGLQDTRSPCLSLSPRVCSNSCPLNWWCYPIISSSVTPFSSCPPSFPVFSKELALCIRWSKYWSFSFSISPSNEHSVLISFRIDCFDLLAVKGTQESSPAQFQSINSLMLSLMVQHPYMTTSKVTVLTIWMSAKWCLWFLVQCLCLL